MENDDLVYIKRSGNIYVLKKLNDKLYINNMEYKEYELSKLQAGLRVRIVYGKFTGYYGTIDKVIKHNDIIVKLDNGKMFIYPDSGIIVPVKNDGETIRFNRQLEILWQ